MLTKASAGFPSIPGSEGLARFIEFRFFPDGTVDGTPTNIVSSLRTYARWDKETTTSIQNLNSPGGGSLTTFVFRLVDQGRRAIMLKPSTVAPNHLRFVMLGTTFFCDFRELFGPVVLTPGGGTPTGDTPDGLCTEILAWVRKDLAADTTHARFSMGFADSAIVTPSAPIAKCGLIGDGTSGFRFGSVQCPNGAAAGDIAANAIDANSVQPPELVNPGANWFHVRIKLVPPSPTRTGRWAAYLNGRLVSVFANAANFPRGGQAVDHSFGQISAGFIYNFDAVQLNGILLSDIRVRLTDDFSI